jgi:isocitrate lyase
VAGLRREWQTAPRWAGVRRRYEAADVIRLRGPVVEERTLARLGAERLWELLRVEDAVRALGAHSGDQAVQLVRAGLQALCVSGEQRAAGADPGGADPGGPGRPDQAADPAPQLVRWVNNALLRAEQLEWAQSLSRPAPAERHWRAPVVADAQAGLGGLLNAFELMTAMIEAGAAGVCFSDLLISPKESGHLGAAVLVPTGQHIQTLTAARLAADVCGVPSLVIARTGAHGATLVTSDRDDRDREFITGARTAAGFYRMRDGIEAGVARGLAYAPYCDLLWLDAPAPDLDEARRFAEAVTERYPDQILAYDCPPLLRASADADAVAKFQKELAAMGYRFQFAAAPAGPAAARPHRETGPGYLEQVTRAVTAGPETFAFAGASGSGQFAVPLD